MPTQICSQLNQDLLDLAGELREAENGGDRDWIIADMDILERKLQANGCVADPFA